MEAFISWLESELKKRDWQPTDLARKAGLHTASITRVLNGTRNPGPDICRAIAHALNYSPEIVFRQAGLLPPDPEEPDLEIEEAIHLFKRLREDHRQFVLRALRAWAEDE